MQRQVAKATKTAQKISRSYYPKKKNLHVQHTFFLISKKTTLHAFYVHFFAVVLHDNNVKLPEIS